MFLICEQGCLNNLGYVIVVCTSCTRADLAERLCYFC